MSPSSYEERQPAVASGRLVACLWTRRNTRGAAYVQRVVPDGCVDVVWSGARLEVVGPDRVPRGVPVGDGAELAGVRFRPGTAGLLLGAVPVREFCDLQVPLAEVIGAAAAERLAERLAGVRGPREAAAELDAFTAGLAPGWTPDRAVERAVAVLGRPEAVRLPELASGLGLSERQLRRRVTDAVGYPPKTLQAVLRFQRALAGARSGGGGEGGVGGRPGLAEVAVRAGYADQAHLTREVRRWAGVPPTVLLGRSGGPGRSDLPDRADGWSGG
ncbi:DUF6597 domain-containing transcriptional factor [Kitasatospora sp. NPDC056327]|uniref:DUF6597 domain-containing transcriptional factor n=1 Tax=Kitasatospora sp. NPDC056327 TaxID=3345785 RepID=UPI0035D83DD2